jgi:uncharacterized delta-60 repeat protein
VKRVLTTTALLLAFTFVSFSTSVFATPANDATAKAQRSIGINTTTLSWTHTTATGIRALFVTVTKNNAALILSVSYGGSGMLLVGNATSSNFTTSLYYLLQPATGAKNVTVTTSARCDLSAISQSYTNVFAVLTPVTGTNTVKGITNTVTTTNTNSWILGAYGEAIKQATVTAPTPEVLRNSSGASGVTITSGLADRPAATPAAFTMIFWSNSAGTEGNVAVEIVGNSPTFTKTITRTITPTFTITQTVTPTVTPTFTITATPTYTATITPTVTQTISQTVTPTYTVTQTVTPTITLSATWTVTRTTTMTPTITCTCLYGGGGGWQWGPNVVSIYELEQSIQDSVGNYNGTGYNAVYNTAPVMYGSYSASSGGLAGNYFTLPASLENYLAGQSQWTIQWWFWPENPASGQYQDDLWVSKNDGWPWGPEDIWVALSNYADFYGHDPVSNVTSADFAAGGQVVESWEGVQRQQWHLASVEYDGASYAAKFYIDQDLIATVTGLDSNPMVVDSGMTWGWDGYSVYNDNTISPKGYIDRIYITNNLMQGWEPTKIPISCFSPTVTPTPTAMNTCVPCNTVIAYYKFNGNGNAESGYNSNYNLETIGTPAYTTFSAKGDYSFTGNGPDKGAFRFPAALESALAGACAHTLQFLVYNDAKSDVYPAANFLWDRGNYNWSTYMGTWEYSTSSSWNNTVVWMLYNGYTLDYWTLPEQTWDIYQICWDGSQAKFYLNGTLQATRNTDVNIFNDGGQFQSKIGIDPLNLFNYYYFRGCIDEAIIACYDGGGQEIIIGTPTFTVTPTYTPTSTPTACDKAWQMVGPEEGILPEYAVVGSHLIYAHESVLYLVHVYDYGYRVNAVIYRFDGEEWEKINSTVLTGTGSNSSKYAITVYNGIPYVAYTDSVTGVNVSNNQHLNVVKFNGSSWELVGNGRFSDMMYASQDRISLSVSDSGAPYVAYCEYANSYKPRVKKLDTDTNTWVAVGGYCSDYKTTCVSLYVMGETPYMAYVDFETGYANKATVKMWDGSTWVLVGSQGFTGAAYVDLCFDGSLEQPMAYLACAGSRFSGLKVMKNTGYTDTKWDLEGQSDINPGAYSYYPKLIIENGVKYLQYLYVNKNDWLAVKKYNGDTQTWNYIGGLFDPYVYYNNYGGFYVNNGIPYVSTGDLNRVRNGGQLSVMKYDCYTYIPPTPTYTITPCVYVDGAFGTGGIVADDSAAGGNGADTANGMTITSGGSIIMTGFSANSYGNTDMSLMKYSGAGAAENFNGIGKNYITADGTAGGNDAGNAVAIDGSGNIYAAGYMTNSSGNKDMAIWKYLSTGQPDTTFGVSGVNYRIYDNNVSGDDAANGIAIDSAGRLVATGYVTNSSGNKDMAVWRYSGSGAPDTAFGEGGTYYRTHNNAAGGGSSGDDAGNALSIDGSGNILITGYSYNSTSGSTDMAVWKYKDDGELDDNFYYGRGYYTNNSAGTGDASDSGNGILIDHNNRILVAGTSENSGGGSAAVVWRCDSNGYPDAWFNEGRGHNIRENENDSVTGMGIAVDICDQAYMTGTMNSKLTIWKFKNSGVLDTAFNNGQGYVCLDSAWMPAVGRAVSAAINGTAVDILAAGSGMSPQNYDAILVKYKDGCSACVATTPTSTWSASPSPSPTKTITRTWTMTWTMTGTRTATPTKTISATITPTKTSTPTRTESATCTATNTNTPTRTITETRTATGTRTMLPEYLGTSTNTPVHSPTISATVTETRTSSPTRTNTRTITETRTQTPTKTITQTRTMTLTRTISPTHTETSAATMTRTGSATKTPANTKTITRTNTPTRTPTDTFTITETATIKNTETVSRTITDTRTFTMTPTCSPTYTNTPTITETGTYSPFTPTYTATQYIFYNNVDDCHALYSLEFELAQNMCALSKKIEVNLKIINYGSVIYWMDRLKVRYWYRDEAAEIPDLTELSETDYNFYSCETAYNYDWLRYMPTPVIGGAFGALDERVKREITAVDQGMQNKTLDLTFPDAGDFSGRGDCWIDTDGDGEPETVYRRPAVLSMDIFIKKDTDASYYIDQGNDWSFSHGKTGLVTAYYRDDSGTWWEIYGQEPVDAGAYHLYVDCGGFGSVVPDPTPGVYDLYKRDHRYAKGGWGVFVPNMMLDSGTSPYRSLYIYRDYYAQIPGVTSDEERKVYQSVLQNRRAGGIYIYPNIYKFDNIPNGTYDVTFKFAEIDRNVNEEGHDLQNIYIDSGSSYIKMNQDSIDIYKESWDDYPGADADIRGRGKVEKTYEITVTNGQMAIKYESVNEDRTSQPYHGCLAGLEIELTNVYLGQSPKIKPVPTTPPAEIPESTPEPASISSCSN